MTASASPPTARVAELDECINIFDLERVACSKVSRMVFDYYASGAHDELTLAANRAAFDALSLAPHVLRDVSRRDLSVKVLGRHHSAPLIVAPMAMQRLADAEGELAMARAAESLGLGMVLSTVATTGVEEVRKALTTPLWFQLYVYPDRELTRALVQRAEAARAEAIVLTVDTPFLGRRERDVRNEFRLPEGIALAHEMPGSMQVLPHSHGASGLAVHAASMLNSSLTWKDVEWLSSITKLPVLVKGILRANDAIKVPESGAAGLVISNHGGRQLDTSIATVRALPAIAEAVGDRTEILLDGGIRRGTDVLKALALGARAVLVGRAALWGLCAGGEAGARLALTILRDELDLAMALCGCRRVAELTRDLVVG